MDTEEINTFTWIIANCDEPTLSVTQTRKQTTISLQFNLANDKFKEFLEILKDNVDRA